MSDKSTPKHRKNARRLLPWATARAGGAPAQGGSDEHTFLDAHDERMEIIDPTADGVASRIQRFAATPSPTGLAGSPDRRRS